MIASLLFAVDMAAAEPARCSPPIVMLAENDKAFTVRFWAGTPRRRRIEGEIRAAFKSACKYGLLKGSTIAKLHGVSSRRLYLSNAPHANVASLYDRGGRLMLEYPFVAADRTMHVPSAKEIQEAILCAVHGASARDQEESGRCLPD
jgi:hypothetical protein